MAKYKCPNCGGEFDEWGQHTEAWFEIQTDTTSSSKPIHSYRCPWCGQEKGKYVPPKRVEYPPAQDDTFYPYNPWVGRVWISTRTR